MPTVFATPDHLPELRAQLAASRRVAVDTEFHAERRYVPELLLVQVYVPSAAGGTTWIVDPLVEGLLAAIGPDLVRVPWVVHAGHHDLALLHAALGAVPPRVQDTQIAAGLLRSDYPASYATLVKDLLGVPVDKGATLSDWRRRPLSTEQLQYASRDVELLLPLWDVLEDALRQRDRLDPCGTACDEARDLALDPPPDDTLVQALVGLGHLEPEQAAIAQELVVWREDVARRTDQPARSVLADGLVLDLARRRPSTVPRMSTNRRFPPAVARRFGPELVEVILRAQRRPSWGWPAYVRAGTTEALTLDFLTLWAEVHARRTALSARLVLPRERLAQVILTDDLESLGAWRGALVGSALRSAWEGRVALHLDKADGVGIPTVRHRPAHPDAT